MSDPLEPEQVRDILEATEDADASSAVSELLKSLSDPPPAKQTKEILDGLRKRRRFDAMARFADGLTSIGDDSPYVRRQHAQALIEQGQLAVAESILQKLAQSLSPSDAEEKSEAFGLLGRVYKQRFVRFANDRDRASRELVKAIGSYQTCYPLDPAWHGANLVGLVHRAEREGVATGGQYRSEDVAATLLRDLQAIEKWTPWTHAAAANAYLALNDLKNAGHNYGEFTNHEHVDAFALAAESRQLREIWGVSPGGDDPASKVLFALDMKALSTSGSVSYSSSGLASVASALQAGAGGPGGDVGGELQAILGENPTQPLKTIVQLVEASARVCQIVDRDLCAQGKKSGGTGFLINGADLGLVGPVLVTNNHVLSEDGRHPSVRVPKADVIFHFWRGQDQQEIFRVRELLWHSPRENLDAAIAVLEDEDGRRLSREDVLATNDEDRPLPPRDDKPADSVYLIGHPDGRGLEISLSDNRVVDHEVDEHPASPRGRRIHYGAPTERGMSGSPLLDQRSLRVLGLHRIGRAEPLRAIDGVEAYLANEAVWIRSIFEAFQAN